VASERSTAADRRADVPARRRILAVLAGLALLFTALHHVDHIARDAVGWPLAEEPNPFTASLIVYPVIGVGLAFLARGHLWPTFWAFVGLAGVVSVSAIHVGPEPAWHIPDAHESPWADVAALAVLAGLLLSAAALMATAVAARRAQRATRGRPGTPPLS
jgi:hypothetical protein